MIPIFVVGIVKPGQSYKAILALNRLCAVENFVEVFSLAHPPGEFLEGDRFREIPDHRFLFRTGAQKPIAHYLVDSGFALGGGHLVFSSLHGFSFLFGVAHPLARVGGFL